MVENIRDNGKMVNNIVKVNFTIQKITVGEKEFGAMGKELNGTQFKDKFF